MAKLVSVGGAENWATLLNFLPEGGEDNAKELGALVRLRRFAGPEELHRALLIHLVEGCSLRETAVRAKYGGVAVVADVALLKRLKASGEWLRWMAAETLAAWLGEKP